MAHFSWPHPMICYDRTIFELRCNYLKIWNLREQKHQNIEKITFKVVQMKFLKMHITNSNISFVLMQLFNRAHAPDVNFWSVFV